MYKLLKFLSFAIFLTLVSCEPEDFIQLKPVELGNEGITKVNQQHGSIIQDEYIVFLKDDLPFFEQLDQTDLQRNQRTQHSLPSQAEALVERRSNSIETYIHATLAEHHLNGAEIISVYDLGRDKGALVHMNEQEAAELAKDERISMVEPNEVIALGLTPGAKGRLIPADGGPAKQMTPYNINAVGGFKNHRNGNTWAFVIDSGIDLDHPDLEVQEAFSKSFVPHNQSPNDGFGHGTHVAGIIGAKNDGRGVVGVAAGAPLVAYRVLDDNGYGTKDNLVQALMALQYDCIPGDVVNISLATDDSPLINSLISKIQSSMGIYFIVASGNEGIDATNISPANLSAPNVYIVGAIDEKGIVADFSNFGKSVNYLAPGVGIYSTYLNGQYTWMDGTSMAAPHIAGILLANEGDYDIKTEILLPSGNYAEVLEQD